MPTNESGLVAEITKAVKARWPRAWVFKVVGGPYQMNGVPDLLICVEGILIGAEAKFLRPGESPDSARGRVTQLQRLQIKLINQAGGMAGVVMSVEDTIDLIERALAHRGPGNIKEKET